MGGRGSGFAAMSKVQLRKVGSEGGKNANKSGTKREWTQAEAKAAAAKGTKTRMARLAVEATKRLISWGYQPEQLDGLKLTDLERIYYGGGRAAKAPNRRKAELDARLAEQAKS